MRKFMRTRGGGAAGDPSLAAAAAATSHSYHNNNNHHKLNGHANGNGNDAAGMVAAATAARRDDPPPSSLSSGYWRGSRGGVGGAGGGRDRSGGAGVAGVTGSARGEWFCDEEFPAHWRSLGHSKYKDVVWLRPHELSGARATFAEPLGEHEEVEDHERWAEPGDGGREGREGDGALCVRAVRVAAAALAADTPRLLRRALNVPCELHPRHARYCGRHTFVLWQFGSWRSVVVDDRLPTRRGRLLTSRGAQPHDYTLPLLEKAFAKLYGSYAECAVRCSVTHALCELSGGVVQRCATPHDAAPLLRAALPRATLVIAVPKGSECGAWRTLRSGLVAAQPYCVSGLARVRTASPSPPALLVRVRAACARGRYTQHAPRALSPHDADLLHDDTNQHHFWMPMESFCECFGGVWLVHVGPDEWVQEAALRARGAWRAAAARRRWRVGVTAGGPPPAPEALANPQFVLRVPAASPRTHVVVAVTQAYSPRDNAPPPLVGFALYADAHAGWGGGGGGGGGVGVGVCGGGAGRVLDAAHGAAAREAASFFTLRGGTYRVVPHAAAPHRAGAFLLRVYTDTHTDIWEVNEDNVMIPTPAIEFLLEPQVLTSEGKRLLIKLFGDKDFDELLLEAGEVCAALRRTCVWWRGGAGRGGCGRATAAGGRGTTLALVHTLCALAAPHDAARLPAARLPALLHALHYWAHSFLSACASRRGAAWWAARGALAACGARVSNKVLEALLSRHVPAATLPPAPRAAPPSPSALRLSLPHALHALATLALAHERYRQLESRLKSNPLSLEETILMTICS